MSKLKEEKSPLYNEELYELSRGPESKVHSFDCCIVNGIRFICVERDTRLSTQNSGVYAIGDIDYYGHLTKVVVLEYRKGYQAVLFKCQLFDSRSSGARATLRHEFHLASINVNTRWYESEPFILAIQAKQVFYVDDPKLGFGWKDIQKMHHRCIWDIPENEIS